MPKADGMLPAVNAFLEPTLYQRAVGVAAGVALILLTISLLRKFRMQEGQGLPWLLGGLALILFSLFPSLLRVATLALGAGTPSTILFAVCILFLLAVNLQFSLLLSQHKKQIQTLVIEMAIGRVEKPPSADAAAGCPAAGPEGAPRP